jgi:hypothetical protein
VAVKAPIPRRKGHGSLQAAVCYSLTQRRKGGPIFNLSTTSTSPKSEEINDFVLKDMAGMCFKMTYAIKRIMRPSRSRWSFIPHQRLRFHEHRAIEAGDGDTAVALARVLQPAIEPLVVAWRALTETNMDSKLIEIGYDLRRWR